jgi:hypothetical protein
MESRDFHTGDPDYYLYLPSVDEQYGAPGAPKYTSGGGKLSMAVCIAAFAALIIGGALGLALP